MRSPASPHPLHEKKRKIHEREMSVFSHGYLSLSSIFKFFPSNAGHVCVCLPDSTLSCSQLWHAVPWWATTSWSPQETWASILPCSYVAPSILAQGVAWGKSGKSAFCLYQAWLHGFSKTYRVPSPQNSIHVFLLEDFYS